MASGDRASWPGIWLERHDTEAVTARAIGGGGTGPGTGQLI